MAIRTREIAVRQLPETLRGKQGRLYFSELRRAMTIDRACVVLDCSQLRHMDQSAVFLLLGYLEDALMCDVDVKLAAVSSEAKAILRDTGLQRLFESFDTRADAIGSFRHPSVDSNSNAYVPFGSH
jgi:anti-anti-sigma factor